MAKRYYVGREFAACIETTHSRYQLVIDTMEKVVPGLHECDRDEYERMKIMLDLQDQQPKIRGVE